MGKMRSAKQWRRLVQEQVGSGLSGAAFCLERGLCRKTFYTWRKRLQADTDNGEADEAGFAEVVERISGRVGSGVSIRLDPVPVVCLDVGFDRKTLHSVLSVLGGPPST
ncbi:MAG: hypothetical protein HN976_22545 [Lentisphaerae bacterium]|jgi:hypothetical protein|nr:hypothetical protein [Lentisphaerota bacterium]MBT7057890.1 hypothetical protein [Lentisphaerota bacterium]